MLQFNKAKEVYHYCSLSCYVFHTDKFMQGFFHVSIHNALGVAMSETKAKHGAFNINQANNLLTLYINYIVPSGLGLIFWRWGTTYSYECIISTI